jgi:hypothetical protein
MAAAEDFSEQVPENRPCLSIDAGSYQCAIAAEEDYSELIPEDSPCLSIDTAERGIELKQLLAIVRYLRRRCAASGAIGEWVDNNKSSATCGQAVTIHQINLYHLTNFLLKPATARRACSYVELVALSIADQFPEWFTSHWWGEPICHFVACIQNFARLRGGRAAFWVCAYANNQHDLSGDVTSDPAQSSFNQAMRVSRGTVMVLDTQATAFWRIWCGYEAATTLHSEGKILDIVTFCPSKVQSEELPEVEDHGLDIGGSVVVISDGVLPVDEDLTQKDKVLGHTPASQKALRERDFPLDLMKRGLNISIHRGQASVDSDRVHILNSIAKRDLEAEPLMEHPEYQRLNCLLRARFAMAMLFRTVGDNRSTDSWQKDLFDLALRNIAADTSQTSLRFDFPASKQITDAMVWEVAECLPKGLECFSFGLSRSLVGDAALESLSAKLKQLNSMRELQLSFFESEAVGDKGVVALSKAMAGLPQLRKFVMDFSHCANLGDIGVRALATELPRSSVLRELNLNFSNCDWVTNDGIQLLSKSVCRLGGLTEFQLRVASCTWIGNPGVEAVGRSLGANPNLLKLCLNFHECDVGDEGLVSLGNGIGALTKLEDLTLLFSGAKSSTQKSPTHSKGKGKAKGKAGISRGISSLAGCLRKLPALANFSLNLDGWNGTADLRELCAGIGSLTTLRRLRLYLLNVDSVEDVVVQELSAAVSGMGDTLRELLLNLSGWTMSVESAVNLAAAIGGSSKLTELMVNISRTGVSDDGLRVLAASCEKFNELSSLSLSSHDESVSDAGVLALANSLLRVSKCLTDFSLNVRSSKVGPDSLAALAAAAAQLDLTELNLNFSGCSIDRDVLLEHQQLLQGPNWQDVSALSGSDLRLQFSVRRMARCGGKGKGKGKGKEKRRDAGQRKHKKTQSFSDIALSRQEELRKRVSDFVSSDNLEPMSFGAGQLQPAERRFVHEVCQEYSGLVTNSFGTGADRNLTIFKEQSPVAEKGQGQGEGNGKNSQRRKGKGK